MLALDRAGIRGFVNPKRVRPDEEALALNIENLKRLVLEHLSITRKIAPDRP
jgi:hypothetical protein